MSFNSNGNLGQLTKNLSELGTTSQVRLTDLLDAQFISSCSKYSSLEELFNGSGFKLESKEDFAAIPDDQWEAFIVSSTSFGSWQEMQYAALEAYTKKKLFSGLK